MGIVTIDEILFKHCMSPEQLASALAELTLSRETARQLRGQLQAAVDSSAIEGQLATAKFLTSSEVVIAAAVKANKQLSWRKRATLDHCLAMPFLLDVKCPLSEQSRVRPVPKPKKPGEFRVTHDFGILHRTCQNIVKRALGAHFVPRPWQYTFRGIHEPIASVKLRLSQGLVYFATLDIEDYHGSFSPSELAPLLPIPSEWVDHVVLGRHMAVVPAMTKQGKPYTGIPTDKLLIQARRGIPQGSACSDLVAAYCMANLQWCSASEMAIDNYADNFLLLALSASALEKRIKDLVTAIKELPGGHFKLKIVASGHAHEGFDFLGHHLRKKGSVVQTTVSVGNQHSIYDKMMSLELKFETALAKGKKEEAYDNLIERCEYLKGWISAFRECDDISNWESTVLALIVMTAGLWEKDLPHLYAVAKKNYNHPVRPYGLDI